MSGMLRLYRTHFPVTVLGPGVRSGIWVQGCGIGCAGCMSRDTWDPAGGRTVPVAELLGWLGGLPPAATGVTVSGGEPFEQPEPLAELLDGVAAVSRGREVPLDVMVYSGFTLAALERSPARRALLERCDVVVTGPFLPQRAPGGRWRGSANQRLAVRTDLGRQRFGAGAGAGADAGTDAVRPGLQVVLESASSAGPRLRVIGVPAPGELERLERGLAGRGVGLAGTSWQVPEPDGHERVEERTG
jgi:anaerobic ribonucleoside-triphosphate reductase activating protein